MGGWSPPPPGLAMKQVSMISLCLILTAVAHAEHKPQVPECFKVNALIRMDDDHYWANWTNGCSYTIDSVYVTVEFEDGDRRTVGNGVWSMHFVTPGTHQVTRFSTPAGVSDFRTVKVRKVTTSLDEALHPTSSHTSAERTQ
jgi:hypothetical protein